MRTTTLLISALLLAGCGETTEPTTTTPDVVAPAPSVVTVTSKSPEAIAAFERARDLQENFRFADALAAYDEALALDADFAQAHAWRSMSIPGADGLAEIRKAGSLSAGLPDAERKSIEAMLAEREGDAAKAKTLWSEVATLAPDDWRVQMMVGRIAFDEQDFKGAIAPLTKATELAPTQGLPWNLLGYAHGNLGDTDKAVEALGHYVALSPSEANPHDSLGEVLLWGGRLDEAEASFVKSTEVLPSFWIGYTGIGAARSLRGDLEGGRASFEQALATATRPQDKIEARAHIAWAWLAAGDAAKSATALAEAEAEAPAAGVSTAWISIDRAAMATVTGNWAEAVAQSAEAMTRAEAARLEGAEMTTVRLDANVYAAVGEAMLGKTAEAEARIPAIEADAAATPGAQDVPRAAKAAIAIGKKDGAGAVAILSKASPRDVVSAWMLVHATEMTGDAKATDAARAKFLALNERGGRYLAMWATSGGLQALTTTAAADE